jgi:hypothetical protein
MRLLHSSPSPTNNEGPSSNRLNQVEYPLANSSTTGSPVAGTQAGPRIPPGQKPVTPTASAAISPSGRDKKRSLPDDGERSVVSPGNGKSPVSRRKGDGESRVRQKRRSHGDLLDSP